MKVELEKARLEKLRIETVELDKQRKENDAIRIEMENLKKEIAIKEKMISDEAEAKKKNNDEKLKKPKTTEEVEREIMNINMKSLMGYNPNLNQGGSTFFQSSSSHTEITTSSDG